MESSTRKLRRKPLTDLTNVNPTPKQPPPSTPKSKSNPNPNPNPKSKSKLIDNTSTNIGSTPKPESNPRCIQSTSASVGSTPKSDSNPNSKSCGNTSTNIGSTPKVNPKSKSKSIENTSPSIGSNVPTPTSTTPNNCDAHCEQTPLVNNYGVKQSVAKAKGKEKLVDVVPFSCPPAGTSKSIGNDLETQQCGTNKRSKVQNGVDPSKTLTVSRQKRKKDPFKTYTIPRQKSKKMARLSLSVPKSKPNHKDFVIEQLPKDFVIEQNKYFAEVDAFELEEEVVNEKDLE